MLKDIAEEKRAIPNQIVFAWMMHSNPPVIPIMAASNPDQMSENLNSFNFRLNDGDMERLDNAAV